VDGPSTCGAVSYGARCRSAYKGWQMEHGFVAIGLDLARKDFQAHAIGTDSIVLIRRKLDTRKNRNFGSVLTDFVFDGSSVGI